MRCRAAATAREAGGISVRFEPGTFAGSREGWVAEGVGLSSNSVFETLTEWEHQLQHLENAGQHLLGDDFEGPQL